MIHIKQVPIIENIFMTRGKEIHEMLYESSMASDWKEFLETHEKKEDYKEMINNYICYQDNAIKEWNMCRPRYAEIKLYDAEEDFSLVIDRVDVIDKKIIISDYKSDAKFNEFKHDKQLVLYSWFYNKMLNRENYPVYIKPIFLKKKKQFDERLVTKEMFNENLNWFHTNKNGIITNLNNPDHFTPTTSPLCKWCPCYLSGECKEGTDMFNDDYSTMVEVKENDDFLNAEF
jgi:hypothetical protein